MARQRSSHSIVSNREAVRRDMKRAKQRAHLKPRNPIARSPLLGKGGPHGKSTAAKRRQAQVELLKQARDPESES
jgi:hypothetical protein